ncbi:MAG: hypothetical protein ABW185_09110 [Sedimenticola sp.]
MLQTIGGYCVELCYTPRQVTIPKLLKFGDIEREKIDREIERFLDCKIIEPVSGVERGEYISNIFARPKKDGRVRIILNLKQFNADITWNIYTLRWRH